jgi:hypothetical protein
MIRVVHVFNVKRSVPEDAFIAWLDARLDVITRDFGCLERKTWILLDGFSGSYLSRGVRSSVTYREVGGDFNPGVGFLSRRDYRMGSAFLMTYHRPESPAWSWLREIRPHVMYSTFRNLQTGFQESARVHVDAHFELSSGGLFSPAFNWVREGLVEPFAIADGVEVQPGTYQGWEMGWRFNTDQSAPISLNGGIDAGHFLSGSRTGGFASVSYRHGSAATASLRLDHNRVRLAEGEFDLTLASVRAGYFFTPRVYLQSLVQYSDQLDMWSANVRFGWLERAGSGLFIVLNEARGFRTLEGPLNRSVVVKYSRQLDVFGR